MVRWMHICVFAVAVAIGSLLWAGVSQAKFYRFVDEEGRIHFVDDLAKIPDQYLPGLDEYKERYDHLPPDQRAARIRDDRNLSEAVEAKRRIEELEALQRTLEQEAEKARTEAQAVRTQEETGVLVRGNQILVPVRLGYDGAEIEALLLLDTGATSIVLHRDVADQLNLESTNSGTAQLVGGHRIKTGRANLSHFSVGPKTQHNTQVLIIDHDGPAVAFDGLLGMSFLRKYKYSVDYENQVIRWQP